MRVPAKTWTSIRIGDLHQPLNIRGQIHNDKKISPGILDDLTARMTNGVRLFSSRRRRDRTGQSVGQNYPPCSRPWAAQAFAVLDGHDPINISRSDRHSAVHA